MIERELGGIALDGGIGRADHPDAFWRALLLVLEHYGVRGGSSRKRRTRKPLLGLCRRRHGLSANAADRLRLDPALARLGPDVLADDFDPGAVAAAMRAQPDRTLGDALLDQRLLAGVGNIFKSEACFAARVDPWRRLGDLSDGELRAVLDAVRALMLGAVASGRQPHAIYRRRGPCPVCGGPVSSRGQGDANRTTYWCGRCQA